MMRRFLILPPLLLGLSSCQDTQARQQNAALLQRVEALEAQVQQLKGVQVNAPTKVAVTDVTVKAAAQNCALELARALETYRQESLTQRYPAPAEVPMPDACQDQRITWQELKNHSYHFSVLDGKGVVLANQHSS